MIQKGIGFVFFKLELLPAENFFIFGIFTFGNVV